MGSRQEVNPTKVNLVGKVLLAGALTLGIGGAAEACGEGDNSPNTGQRTEAPGTLPSQTGLTESPTPVITEAPTIVPTIPPAEVSTPEPTLEPSVEKLYDPAPSIDDLRASLVSAFGEAPLPKYFDRDIQICTSGNDSFNFEITNNETDALNMLGHCTGLANDVKNLGSGDISTVNSALDKLRDVYFSGMEKFVNKGVVSSAYLEHGQIKHRIDLYFSHNK